MVKGKFNMKNSNNIKYTAACIVACLLLLVAGCKPEFCTLSEEMDLEEIATLSKEVEVDIYIDASFSMVGFIDPGNSYYVRTLQMLERAFISGWPKGSKKFHKFGSNISEISRDQFLAAAFAGFYMDPEFRGYTRIENVIDNANKNNLNIIITDLFQTDADVNLLIDKLNNRFLTKDIAVGVLGIKSQFNGRVWDVGLENLNFDYYTRGRNPVGFRPFYILMFGKYNDIVHFYKMMKVNGLNDFPEKNFIILSFQLMQQLASFENAVLAQTSKIKEVMNILHPGKQHRHVKQFMVKTSAQKAYFDTVINLSLLPHMLTFDPNQLKLEIVKWQWKENPKKIWTNCEKIYKAFAVKDLTLSDSQLKFRTEINPPNFPGDGTYCFKIIIYPPSESYKFPDWVSEWDMDQNLIYHWQQNQGQFKGNTTLNLKSFLNNIWQVIYQKNKPKIAKIYCYIRKG